MQCLRCFYFFSMMHSFYFSESHDTVVLQTCHEKKGSRLISFQLDPLIWETASPRTHKPKLVNLCVNFSTGFSETMDLVDYRTFFLNCFLISGIGNKVN